MGSSDAAKYCLKQSKKNFEKKNFEI